MGLNISIFTEDRSLLIVVDNPIAAAICLYTDLLRLTRWVATWLVTFNPRENKSLLISQKITKPYHPPL